MSQKSSALPPPPPSSQIPSAIAHPHHHHLSPLHSNPSSPHMATATSHHHQPRMTLPALAVHPPQDYPTSSIARYEAAVTPNREEANHSSLSSSPDSPQRLATSSTATPVVPRSAARPQRNPFLASPSVSISSPATTAGSKRTASGTLKAISTTGSASLPGSPAQPSTPTAGRFPVDVASPKNQHVAQVAHKVKTRLSYAMLKVRNDWTTETFEQVEARVSQGQTPISPGRLRVKRESSEGAYEDRIRRHQRTASEPNTAHPLSNSVAAEAPSSRTYESFWREHESNPIMKKILQAKAATHALSSTQTPSSSFNSQSSFSTSNSYGRGNLQPPAQIVPDRDRRTYANPARQPPSLRHSASTQSNASTISMVPNTPPPPPSSQNQSQSDTHAQRTMEQDAVESLIFLSSPGNSQHLTSSQQSSQGQQQQQQQQQQRQVQSPGKRINYARNATTWPRSGRASKQARTSLTQLGMMDSGVGMADDDDVTDEEVEGHAAAAAAAAAATGKGKIASKEMVGGERHLTLPPPSGYIK